MKLKSKQLFLLAIPLALASFAPVSAAGWIAPVRESALQQGDMAGKVLDAAGVPLSGVTVINQQTQSTAQTGSDGSFRIGAQSGQTLRFTYLGYTTQQLSVE